VGAVIVLATTTGGSLVAITDAVEGWLVPPKDLDAIHTR
jgi:glycosyltransferase involved in cell wall biosynthesis